MFSLLRGVLSLAGRLAASVPLQFQHRTMNDSVTVYHNTIQFSKEGEHQQHHTKADAQNSTNYIRERDKNKQADTACP